jgi:hypothetical protein
LELPELATEFRLELTPQLVSVVGIGLPGAPARIIGCRASRRRAIIDLVVGPAQPHVQVVIARSLGVGHGASE